MSVFTQKLEHGCIKNHSQQILGSGEFSCPVDLAAGPLRDVRFLLIVIFAFLLQSCIEAGAQVLEMEILSPLSKSLYSII